MSEKRRRNIEELRDIMASFENDAENLYRYGNPSSTGLYFQKLSIEDQKRLICLALNIGNSKQQDVARYCLNKYFPAIKSEEALWSELQIDDKHEIEDYIEICNNNVLKGPIEEEEMLITGILFEACRKMSNLETEVAYWVLITGNSMDDVTWIKLTAQSSSSFHIHYNLEEEKKYNLRTAMRNALRILHIHNHPSVNNIGENLLASADDRTFANSWKKTRPELADRMMFFTVSGNVAFEYTEHLRFKTRWI